MTNTAGKNAYDKPVKISFILPVQNGLSLLQNNLCNIYPCAFEMVVVLGPTQACSNLAPPGGTSLDGSEEIRSFPDPDNKLRIITGRWEFEADKLNAALSYVSGDYVWIIRAAEMYRNEDLKKIQFLLTQHPTISEVHFTRHLFSKVMDLEIVSRRLTEPRNVYRRIFRRRQGLCFERNMTLTAADLLNGSAEPPLILEADQTAGMGLRLYDYTFLSPLITAERLMQDTLIRADAAEMDAGQWYEQVYQRWLPGTRAELEQIAPVWLGDPKARSQPYLGPHPEVMVEYARTFDLSGRPYRPPYTMQNILDAAGTIRDRFPSERIEVLETGTIRCYHEGGQSTRRLSDFLGSRGHITTIDLSFYSIRVSKEMCRYASNVTWIYSDSLTALDTMLREGRRFHMAFLDSVNQKQILFEEFRRVIPMMIRDSVVIIDDAGITPDGRGIRTDVPAQKGHLVWAFLRACQAEFHLPGSGTQLAIPMHQDNFYRITEALASISKAVSQVQQLPFG
ncbi:MAG: hypothetical protein JW828_13885 [Sedimentisphaerales bacterium]|nr:hypothetical protein [Sedimentisphaerales bacterium]